MRRFRLQQFVLLQGNVSLFQLDMNTCISIIALWEADTGLLTLSDTCHPVSLPHPSALGYYSAQRPVIVERGLGGERIIRCVGGEV